MVSMRAGWKRFAGLARRDEQVEGVGVFIYDTAVSGAVTVTVTVSGLDVVLRDGHGPVGCCILHASVCCWWDGMRGRRQET